MKPFHTIAIPHKDILEGRFTMDIFAADLWEAYNNRGPVEYKDADTFFEKTYLTEGLQNLLNVIHRRIEGNGGDPAIQIQTPFGGGKTHSLIAVMHKAKEWNAKCVVIVGTNLEARETLWSIIEKQLTGKNEKLTGLTSPGKDKLKSLLEEHQPLIILMDEVLEYVTKAAGVKVGQSTLAAQTMAFMQEITETVAILEKVCLVVTLPSSLLEHYDQSAEQLYLQLQKVMGRVEKIYTPVQESEISKVILKRLFTSIDKKKAEKIVKSFIEYAQKENILPTGLEPTEYRDRFINSYPFLPDVIDILYHRWGSITNFQRTRGVLRLLALVVASLKEKNIPYISLADFNLASQEIRQELIKHIGPEYNSVIAQDITDADAGCMKVDKNLGDAYKGLQLASRAGTTIFLYSFSGGPEKGATLTEIKRNATTLNNPSSVIAEVVGQLKDKLFYFQFQGDKYFFSNQPNINRIISTKMENIKDEEVENLEKELLKNNVKGDYFKVFIWEKNPSEIPDTEELKLIILPEEKKEVIEAIIKTRGTIPRVNCNTVFFLFPLEFDKSNFVSLLKKHLAYKAIENDKTLILTEDQKKRIREEIRKNENDIKEGVRKVYRQIGIPYKDGYRKEDLGVPTYGVQKTLHDEVYEKLVLNGEIIGKLAPLVIKERYLSANQYVFTLQILQASYRTPGEPRFKDKTVLEKAIIEGVKIGIFGLGELNYEKPRCIYYKKNPIVGFGETEIIINAEVCVEQLDATETNPPTVDEPISTEDGGNGEPTTSGGTDTDTSDIGIVKNVHLTFIIPKGKTSDVMRIVNYLQQKFEKIEISIKAQEGEISKQDYENKIKEALRQLGIDMDD
ncbi:MAG: DUF499 domain-containing protein [Ignavibacteria bacterium]|jgi:hypothetical protein|nr:DUF499 domain-containing protein [Ignavibacteria bacterium]MDH7528813.1 DUF499 domain-containing protein [Ignavibacteria bacterium]